MPEFNTDHADDHEIVVSEALLKPKRPPLYKVILLNDDFTPMDFVVDILKRFFGMNEDKATQIMLHIHHKGIGVCGIFTKDVAESKVQIVNDYARHNQHPLLCSMEKS